MNNQSDSVSVYVTYRSTTENRFEKSSTWSDPYRFASE